MGIKLEWFKRIITAEDCLPRPSIEQFEKTVTGNKSEWLFLGDRFDVDIVPAWRFGIKALLVDNNLPEILEAINNGFETKDWQGLGKQSDDFEGHTEEIQSY
jgi:hypothetical protein